MTVLPSNTLSMYKHDIKRRTLVKCSFNASGAGQKAPCPVRSDRQTTSLTLTTGVCDAGTKRRGCEQHEYSL